MYNQFEIPGRRDLPPQESWSYRIRHYMQYLVDLQATHHLLESGIAEALAVHQGEAVSSRSFRIQHKQWKITHSINPYIPVLPELLLKPSRKDVESTQYDCWQGILV